MLELREIGLIFASHFLLAQVVDINDDMMENLLPCADTKQHGAMLTTDPCRSACRFRVGFDCDQNSSRV